MGLAGPKRRSKLSADPNNTRWTRDSSTFGHRILTQHGWKPGQYLGAVDAAQASHFTAANASHVRVTLKEDNLGLGASKKREGAETFGLDQFSGLLGRLNGKDTAVLKKEENNRRDVQLRLYQDRKFGGIKFISAGCMVGDDMQKLKRSEVERRVAAEVVAVKEEVGTQKHEPMTAHMKRETSSSSESESPVVATSEEEVKASKRRRKEERRQKREEKAQRRLRRAADKASKTERRQKKLEKRRDKGGKADTGTATPTESTSAGTPVTLQMSLDSGTDSGTASSALQPRNSVRQRYIRQKRMAGLDPKALKEVSYFQCTSIYARD